MWRQLSISCLLLAGCDDYLYQPSEPATGTESSPDTETEPDTGAPEEGWCAVLEMIAVSCLSCHSPGAGTLGGLDLETDPYTALLEGDSAYPGRSLVVPGDPERSFLIIKLRGEQTSEEGSQMPPTGPIPGDQLVAVEEWVAQGATDACGGIDTGLSPDSHHPEGFAEAEAHGLAAKLQQEECVDCHGEDLMGGKVGVSCDSCHPDGWRTDCLFCHGGVETDEGAPPLDIDGTADPAATSFPPHTDHVTTDIHAAYDCTMCHDKPTDVLSLGHLFLEDATPAQAEVDFSGGLSTVGSYAAGSCSNLYCHGDGQGDDGSVTVATGSDACDACHPSVSSSDDAWDRMSGEHDKHLEEGISCESCHRSVVSDGSTILDPSQHVNGSVQVDPESGMSWNGLACAGSCHGELHDEHSWR